jgi:hypothetical protein
LEQRDGLIPKILTAMNIPVQQVRTSVENHLGGLPKVSGEPTPGCRGERGWQPEG